MILPVRMLNDVFFFTHEKNDTSKQSHSKALIWCQNSRFLCDLAAPLLSDLLRSLFKEEIYCEMRAFFVEKGETVQKLEKNSLVYSIVTGENCRRSCNNNSRKGKAIPIKCLVSHRPTDPPPPSPPKKKFQIH